MSKGDIIPAAALGQHTAVLGKTGSGKTYTVKGLIERILREQPSARVCVLDPLKSDHWGLTLAADGKKPGLAFHILGGPYGHVPLHAAAGKALGRVVASGALHLSILDMANFGMGEHARFFIDFAEALFSQQRGVLHLVVEEAHIFAPKEKAGFGEENKSTYWMKRLATGARSKGIRMIVATQRTQELHNAVLGSCETAIVQRMTLEADKAPAVKWLRGNTSKKAAEEIEAGMASLKTGEGWVCSGEAQFLSRMRFPSIWTYDNSATPASDTRRDSARPPAVDAEALRAIVGDAVKDAEANDPRRLKARIAELERLGTKTTVVDERAIERAVAARDREWDSRIRDLQKAAEGYVGRLRKIGELAHLNGEAKRVEVERPGPVLRSAPPRRAAERTPTQAPARRIDADSAEHRLSSGQRTVLTCIAQHRSVDRSQLAIVTGYAKRTLSDYVTQLRTAGLLDGKGTLELTQEGYLAVGDFEPLPTGDALRNHWIGKLPAGEGIVLSKVCEAYPGAIDRGALSEKTGYAPRTLSDYVTNLSRRKLVCRTADGIRASEELFG